MLFAEVLCGQPIEIWTGGTIFSSVCPETVLIYLAIVLLHLLFWRRRALFALLFSASFILLLEPGSQAIPLLLSLPLIPGSIGDTNRKSSDLSRAVNLIPDTFIIVDRSGHILDHNNNGDYGIQEGSEQKHVHDLDLPDISKLESNVARSIERGREFSFETKGSDGRGHIEIRVFPVEGGLAGILIRDITRRFITENCGELVDESLEGFFKNGPVGFFITDSNGLILKLNSAFSRLFSLHPGDMTGKNIRKYITTDKTFPFGIEKGCGNISVGIAGKKGKTIALMGNVMKSGNRRLYPFFAIINGDKKIIEAQKSIIKEMHHRVKNNLQIISGLLSIKGHLSQSSEITNFVQETQERLKAMSLVHELLILGESEIDLDDYVGELLHSLLKAYPQKELNLSIDMDGLRLNGKRAMYIGIAINELVVNSLKHAWQGNEKNATNSGKVLKIFAKSQKDDKFMVCVEDNGKGIPENLDINQTLGLSMVDIMTEQMGGRVEIVRIQSEKKGGSGTKIALIL